MQRDKKADELDYFCLHGLVFAIFKDSLENKEYSSKAKGESVPFGILLGIHAVNHPPQASLVRPSVIPKTNWERAPNKMGRALISRVGKTARKK